MKRDVDLTGTGGIPVARYEYEVCYRCHAGVGADQFTSLSAQLPLRLFRDYDETTVSAPPTPPFTR